MKWVAILAIVSALVGAVAWVYWTGRQQPIMQQKVSAAQDGQTAAALTTQGVRQTDANVHLTVTAQQAAGAVAAQAAVQAQAAGDAHAPLDPDRAARLRANDHQLCGIDPVLAGCAPAN